LYGKIFYVDTTLYNRRY